MNTTTEPETVFTPGWYVVRGVSHYFWTPGSASLCRKVTHSPRCERRRRVKASQGIGQLAPAADGCDLCRDEHTRLWCEGGPS